MSSRPYVLLSAAVSLDGYLDDTSGHRLLLSNDEDRDRVDEVRAGVDAILVGAGTIRADDPRLLVRCPRRQQRRERDGRAPTPAKVTITESGHVPATSRFCTTGASDKLVYTTTSAWPALREQLSSVATVVSAGDPLDLAGMLADLADRNIEQLLVEGGSIVHTQFLAADLVDELHLVYAPFFVGEAGAPRLVNPAAFPQNPANRMTLAGVRQLGDLVLLRYYPRRHD